MPVADPVTIPGRLDDARVSPGYYVRGEALASAYIAGLLARAATVFDIKALMTADLDDPASCGLDCAVPAGAIAAGAIIEGPLYLEPGAHVHAGAHVIGPVLICSGAVIAAGSLVRDHCVIGPGSAIGFGAEITRSLLVESVFMKHVSFAGDSLLGQHVHFGAFCSTTGMRSGTGPVREPATEEITVTIDGERVGTGQTKFGAVIGDGVGLPAGTVLSPGTLIGPGTVIYPHTHVGGLLPAGSRIR
jgi:UDP-N-acetylglucosamine diphosphorylase / glucose-1-phosphate thymidylyltransferase / UDP-N-acetylgalactosamine diphosphorylase / glucosamine-1-phosphate N-acetyltransferase / galactosamine-1-phosphate N-acetyltransferase